MPAVRERMRRIRFLTAMAVVRLSRRAWRTTLNRDASPYLVWEWLVVEAIVREIRREGHRWGTGSTHGSPRHRPARIPRRASYLKTPRIFGFHGIYKRLAVYLGLVDVHLGPGPNAEKLADAWARGQGLQGCEAKQLIARWRAAVQRGLNEQPPRTEAALG